VGLHNSAIGLDLGFYAARSYIVDEAAEEPDQRSEDRAVGPVEPGPRIGAAQHSDLARQHEQLSIL
jgi:hypothetical protein